MSHFTDVKARSRKIFKGMLVNPNTKTDCSCGANPHSPDCALEHSLEVAWERAEDEIWEQSCTE